MPVRTSSHAGSEQRHDSKNLNFNYGLGMQSVLALRITLSLALDVYTTYACVKHNATGRWSPMCLADAVQSFYFAEHPNTSRVCPGNHKSITRDKSGFYLHVLLPDQTDGPGWGEKVKC